MLIVAFLCRYLPEGGRKAGASFYHRPALFLFGGKPNLRSAGASSQTSAPNTVRTRLRKVRWAAKSHGKRGGARVIYFWWMADERILLLDIYAKCKQENLSADEIKELKRKVIR